MLTIGAMRVFRFLKIWQRQHERDRVILAREEFSLRAVCEEVHRATRRAFPGLNQRLRVDAPTRVRGSRRHLKHVVRFA